MSQPSLRELARQYASGALQKTDYRRTRAELIRSILDAEDTVPPLTRANFTVPAAGAEDNNKGSEMFDSDWSDFKFTIPSKPAPEPEPIAPIKLGPDWRIPAGAGAAVLVLIVLAVLLLPGTDRPEQVTSGSAAPAEEVETIPLQAVVDPDNQAVAVLKDFTEAPRWDQAALDALVEEWRTLPTEEREAALESAAARRLADLLNRRMMEERALRGGDSETWQVFQEKTLEFAANLGLEDRRLRKD